jgi:hypothetical protein
MAAIGRNHAHAHRFGVAHSDAPSRRSDRIVLARGFDVIEIEHNMARRIGRLNRKFTLPVKRQHGRDTSAIGVFQPRRGFGESQDDDAWRTHRPIVCRRGAS